MSSAQSTDETSASSLPISIERVRDALGRKPVITVEEILAAPTFRVLIEEQPFRWEPLFTPADVSVGVLSPGPAHHYEFLRMFSPELTRPYAAFNQQELLLVTIETLATTLAVRAGTAGVPLGMEGNREAAARAAPPGDRRRRRRHRGAASATAAITDAAAAATALRARNPRNGLPCAALAATIPSHASP